MKLSVIIGLCVLFFTQLTRAWPAPDFSNFLRRHSRVPSFIIDIDHPWIKEKDNLYKLWRLDDPKAALCNLSSELRPSNDSHGFTYPADLFKTLQLDTKWSDDVWWSDWSHRLVSRKSDWGYIAQQVNEIANCPAALANVQQLNWSNPPVEAGVAESFVKLLTSMPHLRKLDWTSFGDNDHVFRDSFSKSNLTLPALRHLSLTSGPEFLIGMCPGIESIHYRQTMRYWQSENEIHPTIRLLQSLDFVPGLKSFSMGTGWNLEHVEVLLEKCPKLVSLTMENDPYSPYAIFNMSEQYSEVPGEKLRDFTNVLAKFPCLETLQLPYVSQLGTGYDGGPGCGNVYFGASGRSYGRYETRRRVAATELAAEIVLDRLPRLKTLSMGGPYTKIMRDEHGQANASWPWTGRLTEYTFEMWPEKYPGEDADYQYRIQDNASIGLDEDF